MRHSATPILVHGLGLASFFSLASANGASLDSVHKSQANLTTFRGLVKEHADIYDKLPKEGVTIIAPNNGAFIKGQGWDDDEASIPAWLYYGMFEGEFKFDSLSPGDTRTVSTRLDNPKYSNVTDGQNIFVTIQPGGEVVLTSGVGTHVTVVGADIPFDGGIVQVVESLMVTPRRLETSIRDSYKDLSGFLGALYKADLVQEFAETPNATIFAPHNSAFQRLAGVLEDLDEEEFRRVLRYHLVPNAVLRAVDLQDDSDIKTDVDKKAMHITRYINDIYINSARIIQTDLLVANGVIQMIDNVLNVDEHDARPDVTQTAQDPVFAVTGSPSVGTDVPVPFTSVLPCTASCISEVGSRPTSSKDGGTQNGEGDDEGAAVRSAGAVTAIVVGLIGMGFMGFL